MSIRFAGFVLVAPIQATPSLRATPQEGKNKNLIRRMRFYIEILSREISHKYKRGVLNESRIVFDNKWGSFCCSRGFFRRISIIKSSHFFEIVVSGITRSSFCTSYSISWTSTKPESSNGIVTHNASTNIELICSGSKPVTGYIDEVTLVLLCKYLFIEYDNYIWIQILSKNSRSRLSWFHWIERVFF